MKYYCCLIGFALLALGQPARAQENVSDILKVDEANPLAEIGFTPLQSSRMDDVDETINCSGSGSSSIKWPASDPIWEFEFLNPAQSSGTEGSGLEIRNVKYYGREFLGRAHVPILNVLYDPGGCGCYRDWNDSPRRFQADGVVTTCYAESTPGTVQSVCDVGGSVGDVGSFVGTSAESFNDSNGDPYELVLTSQYSAGWYRYRMKWHFFRDGRLLSEFAFATVNAACVQATHNHHAYYRYDFDIEGSANDFVVESSNVDSDLTLVQETKREWGATTQEAMDKGIKWHIQDQTSNRGVVLIPSANDYLLPATDFAYTDAMVVQYKPTEIDDGGGFSSSFCSINFEEQGPNGSPAIIDGQNVDGEDVVFWYRGGFRHLAGGLNDCHLAGPMLAVNGGWGGVALDLKLFLQGPGFDSGTNKMFTTLNAGGYLPTSQPYNVAPWNYEGHERIAPHDVAPANNVPDFFENNPDVVDWIMLELRTDLASNTRVARQVALLKADGSVVDVDGFSPVRFNGVDDGDYYVIADHRSHLGVITEQKISLSKGAVTSLDLTDDTAKVRGNELFEVAPGIYGLFAGDGDGNGTVFYAGANSDINAIILALGILNIANSITGYHTTDLNMDGSVFYAGSNSDINTIILSLGIENVANSRQSHIPN